MPPKRVKQATPLERYQESKRKMRASNLPTCHVARGPGTRVIMGKGPGRRKCTARVIRNPQGDLEFYGRDGRRVSVARAANQQRIEMHLVIRNPNVHANTVNVNVIADTGSQISIIPITALAPLAPAQLQPFVAGGHLDRIRNVPNGGLDVVGRTRIQLVGGMTNLPIVQVDIGAADEHGRVRFRTRRQIAIGKRGMEALLGLEELGDFGYQLKL